MKRFLVVLFAAASAIAVAADAPSYNISCGVKKQKMNKDYRVSATVKGVVTGKSGTEFVLDDYSVKYTIWLEGETEEWGSETITGRDLKAREDYDPNEYKDHVAFKLPSKQGKVEFIYPEKLGKTKRFQAHLILTNIQDHNGGTAHVYCTRKKAE